MLTLIPVIGLLLLSVVVAMIIIRIGQDQEAEWEEFKKENSHLFHKPNPIPFKQIVETERQKYVNEMWFRNQQTSSSKQMEKNENKKEKTYTDSH